VKARGQTPVRESVRQQPRTGVRSDRMQSVAPNNLGRAACSPDLEHAPLGGRSRRPSDPRQWPRSSVRLGVRAHPTSDHDARRGDLAGRLSLWSMRQVGRDCRENVGGLA